MNLTLRETRTDHGWRVDLMQGETSVSRCSVVERTIRVGTARLQVGGIGGVGTLREYRQRGYSRQVMEHTLLLLQRERYDISLLHGIQDFYDRFGYATCMPEYELCVDTVAAEQASSPATVRPMRKADLPAIVALYDRDNAERVGTALRPQGIWRGFQIGTWWSVRARVQVVLDARDGITGYVVYDDTEEACRVAEIGGSGEETFAGILHFLAQRAVRLRCERIWLHLPQNVAGSGCTAGYCPCGSCRCNHGSPAQPPPPHPHI